MSKSPDRADRWITVAFGALFGAIFGGILALPEFSNTWYLTVGTIVLFAVIGGLTARP